MRRPDGFYDPALAFLARVADACDATMLAKQMRDRRGEYQRRIERGEAEGKSRAESRGHGRPRVARPTASQVLRMSERQREARSRTHEALSVARQHPERSLSWAARRSGTTLDAVLRHAPDAVERRPSGRYLVKATDPGVRIMPVISAGAVYPRVAVRGSRQASLIGEHLSAIKIFLETGYEAPLRRFAGKTVMGTLQDGRTLRFELEADPDAIAEMAFSGELSDLVVES